MLFFRIEFFLFLGLVLAFLCLNKDNQWKKRVLLLASYYFYAYWDWRFLSLILVSTLVDYVVGRHLARTDRAQQRTILLWVSLTVNLGILGFFKYFNFFIDSAKEMLGPLGGNLQTLDLVLPVGISFYTFQTLSYTLDLYRRKITPCNNFFDFALFVAFFPQLVAGPIVRAKEFLPQLQQPHPLSWQRGLAGFRQFTFGLFKKAFIADNLARSVDVIFDNPGAFDSLSTWIGVMAFAVQIYCDFSGYSDMAIGVARILGYDFQANFNLPYLAGRMDDFWRRWHISLSSWLKDYLYIPLGGNRRGQGRMYVNLLITMVLGGLWHGASWSFVLWGAWHGMALVCTKLWTERTGATENWTLGGWVISLLVVLVGWVFFRAQDLDQALLILRQMIALQEGIRWVAPFTLVGIGLIGAEHIFRRHEITVLAGDKWYTPSVLLAMWWLVYIYFPRSFQPFIYFQF